jgi:DNA gyrase subunit A
MCTHLGRVKRVELKEFEGVRPSGLVAINLEEEDELGWVQLTQGDQDLIVVSEQGQALRFREQDVRPMGRNAMGVYAIKLGSGDSVASASIVEPEAALLVVTTKGYGKRTPLSKFSVKGRHGQGVRCLGGKLGTSGSIAAARVTYPADEITIISAKGMVLRASASDIPEMGRAARGTRIMALGAQDEVASVAVIRTNDQRPR